MINEYKKYLKKNSEDLFLVFTCCAGVAIFFFVTIGGIVTLTNVGRSIRNTKELNVYRENLATFQKCAEKVTDASLVESYCGSAPNEPTLIW
jgi:hypothetical protein